MIQPILVHMWAKSDSRPVAGAFVVTPYLITSPALRCDDRLDGRDL